ncbi:MAG: hypothetical protein HY343_12110 [Lentisphaerae bacterium]|nr:hypothetical protein [Lentisphaerota bacterium]
MNIKKKMIKAYQAAAAEVIGERTPGEIAYDDKVVEGLNQGLTIHQALARAAETHPMEALQVTEKDMPDISARYEYLREHAKLMLLIEGQKRR